MKPAMGIALSRDYVRWHDHHDRGGDMIDREVFRSISVIFEVLGVATIIGGFIFALLRASARLRVRDISAAYDRFRATFGHGLLLGLEIIVAADLIRTIAVEPTLDNLAVLAALVAIRTFLSWALEVEIEGRWPWQRCTMPER
jgi:uncharacterized membrane protein